MNGPINRLNDYLFKRIFGVPENKDLLIDFLNSVILTDLAGPLTDIEMDDREIDPEFLGDKASRLDILGTARNGTRINIEVQIVNLGGPERRTLFYWSRLYGRQLVSGMEYKSLLPVISVNVVNFEFLPHPDRFHQTFLLSETATHEPLTRDCEIHFIEIPKFKRRKRTARTRLDDWLTYLANVQGKEMEKIAMRRPTIRKALTIEEIFAQSEREIRQYELREKGLHDLASIRGLGREEGRAEGQKAERRSFARRLLNEGFHPEKVADLSGMSIEEVKTLTGSKVQEPTEEYRVAPDRRPAAGLSENRLKKPRTRRKKKAG